MAGEFDQRTIHRLEAFSDIVIGFCLAEIGVNLVVPNDVAGLRSIWAGLAAFVFSFFVISMLWWYHHRLFVDYFVLNPASVITNFVLLGALVFSIYFQQVAGHFIAVGADPSVPLHLWLGALAAIFGLLAAMYGVGMWVRRADLEDSSLQTGVSLSYQMVVSSLGLAALAPATPNDPAAILIIVIVTSILAAFHGPIASRLSVVVFRSR